MPGDNTKRKGNAIYRITFQLITFDIRAYIISINVISKFV